MLKYKRPTDELQTNPYFDKLPKPEIPNEDKHMHETINLFLTP